MWYYTFGTLKIRGFVGECGGFTLREIVRRAPVTSPLYMSSDGVAGSPRTITVSALIRPHQHLSVGQNLPIPTVHNV